MNDYINTQCTICGKVIDDDINHYHIPIDIKQQALNHYDRMIEWAKTQNQYTCPSPLTMNIDLGENWLSVDCAYCMKYINLATDFCNLCPLADESAVSGRCCGGLWLEMAHSLAWGDWVKSAAKVREYIAKHG